MVMVFLTIVGIAAVAVSFQNSFLRRAGQKSHLGFEAVELCDSAINEAAESLGFEHIFPPATFSDFKSFMLQVADEDEDGLQKKYSNYKFQFRDVYRDANMSNKIGRIFCAMSWPAKSTLPFFAPRTARSALAIPYFKGPLKAVQMTPLSWRRDFFQPAGWQDWGVVQWKATVTLDDGHALVTRTMYVDRMFTFRVTQNPRQADGTPGDINFDFFRSTRNLRTVIERQ